MDSQNPGYRKYLLSCITLIFVLCGILYISTLPDPPHPDDISKYLGGIPLNDKVGHLVMFFGLGFLMSNFLGFLFKYRGLKNIVISTGFALMVGVVHEVNQYVVGRGYELADIFFDFAGGFMGAMTWNFLVRINFRPLKKALNEKADSDTG